ncbi:MAG: response regulator [Deltaproteobacteria bacterium]|nr:response regulator [Deltaproteobacteria bacterium]
MDLTPFQTLLLERCGIVFEDEKAARLEDGIRTRMGARRLETPEAYFGCLLTSLDEFDWLVDLLTVNETYFFREPRHLKLLTDRVASDLLRARSGPIRILSAGCSTGEEPYSIVLALAEAYGLGACDRFCVTGMDIDTRALARAREAVYGRTSFRGPGHSCGAEARGTAAGFPMTYFEACGEGLLRVREPVRRRVEFLRVNLAAPEYPAMIGAQDVIFYRNVSIYFPPEVKKRIFVRLAERLAPGGYLFLGSSETAFHDLGILDLEELDGVFVYRKAGASRPRRTEAVFARPAAGASRRRVLPVSAASKAGSPAPLSNGRPSATYEGALARAKANELGAALRELDALAGGRAPHREGPLSSGLRAPPAGPAPGSRRGRGSGPGPRRLQPGGLPAPRSGREARRTGRRGPAPVPGGPVRGLLFLARPLLPGRAPRRPGRGREGGPGVRADDPASAQGALRRARTELLPPGLPGRRLHSGLRLFLGTAPGFPIARRGGLMELDRDRFVQQFLEEAAEHCASLGSALVRLEEDPRDRETLDEIFRAAHTIKGSARMMGFAAVSETAHRVEDLLDAVRSGTVPFEQTLSELLFEAIDAIAGLLDRISAGSPDREPPSELLIRLAAALGRGPSRGGGETAESGGSRPQEEPVPDAPGGPSRRKPAAPDTVRIGAEKLDDLIRLMGEIVSAQQQNRQILGELRELVRLSDANLARARARGAVEERETAAALLHASAKELSARARDAASLQEILVGELQERSLRMRMLPLATVFETFPRTVRDLAAAAGKAVEVVLEGGETELDRKIIEKLGECLLHMIRNSVDQGIEPPAERLAMGKSERGRLSLTAGYEAGSVVVRLSDDGRGISTERLREKALQRKLFDEQTLGKMPRSELLELIFLPGFSTSAIISDLSGRGVGMDVVKRNIPEELKGSIAIETEEGKGTSFVMRLPPTLALFRLLLFKTGGRAFAVPALAVREVHSVRSSEVVQVLDRWALRRRGRLVPLERIDTLLGLRAAQGKGGGGEEKYLVVEVAAGERELGLVIDELLTEADMVVKPLPLHLKNVELVSGATIGGRNELIQVLSVPALIRAARGNPEEARERGDSPAPHREPASILVVDDSLNTRELEKSILEAHGYRVVLAGDGEEALAKTRETLFDLVVTDVEMPRLDGFSLTERLRGDERYRDVPIVIVTSRSKDEDRRRGIDVGASAYIVKGDFGQSNLLETVENLIV